MVSDTDITPRWDRIVTSGNVRIMVRKTKDNIKVRVERVDGKGTFDTWALPKWMGLDGAVKSAENDKRARAVGA